jgi:glutamate dehydrogenase (NAD(P)+)
MHVGHTTTSVVTGKPISMGGSLGRREATGRGVMIVTREAAKHLGLDIKGATVAVQGFGNVGSIAAKLFAANGAKIVCVQDHTGTILNENGFDMTNLLEHVATYKGVAGFTGADKIDDENFWDVASDVLIPAALEGQITAERAHRIKTRLVLEGANGPTTPDGEAVLADRGIVVVPDVIANAGGVTVSYFEWVQDFSSFFWTEDEINVRLDKIMIGAFKHIWETSEQHKITLRTAAFTVACTRVLQAREERGLYP